jgi:dTDP-4-dehydrorhamnose 3,5-epimerase
MKFKRKNTDIEGVCIIEPTIFGDHRGFFMETYNKRDFTEIGLEMEFVQNNHSKSTKGVLRGLHYQTKHPQGKLVRVIKGAVYDVAIDIRKDSPTYKEYSGLILSEENRLMFFIPPGLAHGFLALSEEVEFEYMVTDYFYPEYDTGIRWDDSSINIDWPFKENNIDKPIISEKDNNLPFLKDI